MSDEAAFRLPADIRPAHYRIHLVLDLDTWTFQGWEEIDLQLDASRETVELHAVGLTTGPATFTVNGQTLDGQVTPRPARQTWQVTAARPLPAGAARLRLAFGGQIGDKLIGLYRAQVGEDRYAFTQCEPTFARRIFPCFDEPAFKARFTLSVEAPAGLAVISNEPVATESVGGGGSRQVVTFETTPRMSTYLVALAVGRLEASPPATTASGVPVRVWAVPAKIGLSAFPIEAAVAALDRLEAYFGVRYPYRKLDLLAVPDFEAGAMENSGAIFFRERRLLCDPATAPLDLRKGIALVIAHELAHQWFGNLVTMQWWDDLWLNEAFASWIEHVIVDQWRPEWHIWTDFQQAKAVPFHTDALVSTRPIRAAVASAEQVSEMFDAITYEKGAAVLRMLEQYLTPATFREGIRRYVQTHLEGNATADDLFGALAEASAQPIRQVAADWIDQPGYPLLTASLAALPDGRRQVTLRQHRFFLDPHAAATQPPSRWRVPVVLRYQIDGAVHEQRILLEDEARTVPLDVAGDVAWLTANAGESGFYRVSYDAGLQARLRDRLFAALAPAERIGFLDNQWALTRAGHGSAADFLDLLRAMGSERARPVVQVMVDRLAFYRQFLVEPSDLASFAELVTRLFQPAFDELGWSPAPGEDDDTRQRRASVLRALGRIARADHVTTTARRLLEQHWAAPGSIDSNLLDVLVAIAAQGGDAALFEAYLERARQAPTPDEQFRHLMGLAAFEAPDLIDRALALTLTPVIQTQDVGLLLVGLLNNAAATTAAWRFIQDHWQHLAERLPPLMVRRVIQATVNLGTAEGRREVEEFFSRHPVKEAARALRQTLEELALLASFRERARPMVHEYLKARSERASA